MLQARPPFFVLRVCVLRGWFSKKVPSSVTKHFFWTSFVLYISPLVPPPTFPSDLDEGFFSYPALSKLEVFFTFGTILSVGFLSSQLGLPSFWSILFPWGTIWTQTPPSMFPGLPISPKKQILLGVGNPKPFSHRLDFVHAPFSPPQNFYPLCIVMDPYGSAF